jgi:hypothetical protein
MTALTRLPALKIEENRIIKGVLIKYVDNVGWTRHDGVKLRPDAQLLVLLTTRALMRWPGPEVIVQQPGTELPDPKDLNDAIPKPWPLGLDGKESPPWKKEFVAYLLDFVELMILTFHNNTIGAARCICGLEDRWDLARAFYAADVMPLVKLGEAPFPTAYGMRKRPIFEIDGWRRFTDGALRVADQRTTALEVVEPKTLAEVTGDTVPY